MKWTLLGVDFHRRWRSGRTILDLSYNHVLVHHGFYSLDWARGEHVEYFRAERRARKAPAAAPALRSTPPVDGNRT